MDLKRSFILLISLALSEKIYGIPSHIQDDQSIQQLSLNHRLRNAKINVKQIINETQPLHQNLSSIFNSLYENYERNMTDKSLYYLDKIKGLKTNSSENCYTYGYQVMYSAYLGVINNVTNCFKQELQEFKENNIPTDREFKIIMKNINYECHELSDCKRPTLTEIEKMITELENHKNQLLKKDFTNEIDYTKIKIHKCTQFSIENLDTLLDNGILQAIKCDIDSSF
ncbi:hypothetical protein HCN44_008199 [Aphidius gifuensis]|uniref:Odorant-binding protein n=1 Tax=Aphidius gifuensis TaxID=684658 RepID=A0A835CQU7_APHGI|nr:hypothetical protein HCN44_008199 [Aphidius gifuensis]